MTHAGGERRTDSLGAASEASPADRLFAQAFGCHQRGQLAEAERGYRDVLAVSPQHPDALHFAGVAALQLGRSADAVTLIEQSIAQRDDPQARYHLGLALAGISDFAAAELHNRRAIALKPDFIDAHINLGNILKLLGRLDEAAACYRRVIGINPGLASAHYNLANVLLDKGDNDAAIEAYRRALSIDRNYLAAWLGYALALKQQGKPQEALAMVCQILERAAVDDAKSIFADCCASLGHYQPIPGLRKHLIAALSEPWTRARNLARFADAAMRCEGPLAGLYKRATADGRGFDLLPDELQSVASDPLLRAVLENASIASPELECIVIGARRTLLAMAARDEAVDGALLELACAIARQCFISEYVFEVGSDEAGQSARLRDRLAAGERLSPFAVAIVASYGPLHAVPGAARFLQHDWPAAVGNVVTQQVREPALERDLSAAMPQLTPIEDSVSLAVQRQYEENPYPRWVKASRVVKRVPFDHYLRTLFPLAPLAPGGKKASDILVAGCGTGQASLELALQIDGAKILAIDLSRSSLAHAQRKTREARIDTIQYAQADILKLAALGLTFDFIEAGGVLHHMADPAAACRELAGLLRPGGVMRVALYSKGATPHVAATRALAGSLGLSGNLEDIRRLRQAVRASPDGAPARTVMLAPDFYAASECRDLLLHVQEHRLTIPQLKDIVAQSGCAFSDFASIRRLPAATANAFRMTRPKQNSTTGNRSSASIRMSSSACTSSGCRRQVDRLARGP